MKMAYRARATMTLAVRLVGGLAAVALAGCAQFGDQPGQVAAVPAAPMDPLAAFVANAPAGARGMVVYPDGARIPARVTRSYLAASARECREVVLGGGRSERAMLVCQGGPEVGGAWVVARPLLGGAGSGMGGPARS